MPPKRLVRLFVLLSLVVGMLVPAEVMPAALADATWSAYNDCSGTTGGNTTAYTISGSTTGLLKDYATGVNTPVTATFTTSGSPTLYSSNGAMPTNTSSDAYTTFNGFVNMTGVVNYGDSGGWSIDLTFTGLDSGKQYTFVTTANRDDDTYTTRVTQFTLNDADAATNASSSGVTVIDNLNVAFCTGYNTLNGYVAKWTGISPGADQDFSVHFTFYGSEYRAYGPSGFLLQEEISGPTILTSGTLTQFNSLPGTPSLEQSYTVSGLYLTNNLDITPPAGFELSLTSGSGFSSTPISLVPDVNGTVAATTIYVRFNPPGVGTYGGDITHVSSPATTKNVAVTGSSVPTITTTGTLAAFSSAPGVPSPEQSYTVSGVNLTADIVITAPADFQLSLTSGGTFGSSVSLSPTSGVVGATPIYVRFDRATEGTSNGNITHTSTGATQVDVAVSGTASYCVTRSISQSSDDAHQSNTTMSLTGTTLQAYSSGVRRYWGLRFQDVTVPRNATITSASVTFRAAAAGTGTPTINVWGEAADNAATFTTGASNISNRAATSSVAWALTAWTSGQDYTTSSLVTPVQEIVNRAGWASGNAMVIMTQMTATSPANRTVVAWDDTTQANEASLTVCYIPPVYYNLIAGDDGNGSVTLNPPGGTYASGTVVTLTPVPDTGYVFSSWSGDDAGDLTDNGNGTWSITMDSDKSVTANFAVACTLAATTDGHGTVTLSPPGGSYLCGTTVTLTPVGNPGYGFISWVGANAGEISGSGPSYTILVDGDKAVVANFAQLTECGSADLVVAEDTHMRSGTSRGSWNYGGAPTIELRTYYEQGSNDGQLGGALLKWDLATIPTNARVTSASVTLYVTDTSTYSYSLYNMRRAWTEGNNNAATGSGCSWNYYGAGSGDWGTAGAQNTGTDRYDTNLWTPDAGSFSTLGSVNIPLNASGLGVVEGWIAGTLPNYGLTIQNYGGSTIDVWGCSSSEAATVENRPLLKVGYCLGGPANTAPDLPVLVDPAPDGVTGVGTSPTLQVAVGDPDGNTVWVVFYGRGPGAMDWVNLGSLNGVASGAYASLPWPGLAPSTTYEWYAEVGDGVDTTYGPAWTFTTVGPTTGTIIVEKQTEPDGATQLFYFSGDATGNIADGGQIVVSGLAPGAYSATETVPEDWVLRGITCDDGESTGDVPSRTASFVLQAGETVKCTFYNRVNMDYGDAPDSYKTLYASDGARHLFFSGGPILGYYWDAEPDGLPSTLADGDDLDYGPDEDGLVVIELFSPGDTGVRLNINGGPLGGNLDAWIDFDHDGVFDHPEEHLWNTFSQWLDPGTPNTLYFDAPATAVVGWTYARFRLSVAGGLLPYGLAPDGEVEDYRIEISPLNHTVTFEANGGTGTMDPQVANAPTALTLNSFTWTGYTFSGWNTAANGSGTAYTDGETYSFAADLTLFAQWTVGCYKLTLGHTGSGSDPIATPGNSDGCDAGYYHYDEIISLSGAVPVAGWGIAGWYGTGDDTGTGSTNSLTMPAYDHEAGVNYLRLLGDVDLSGTVDSTDALIVLTADAGLPAGTFCPMNYGDVDGNGLVDSTDALIILTYDVGLPVGTFQVGQPVVEPAVTQPPGCTLVPPGLSRWSRTRTPVGSRLLKW